jgi:5-oxoprolinase (ATP-hydrolysing) subunit A
MPYLARVSIACGGHAGDAASMAARCVWRPSMAWRRARTRATRTARSSAAGRWRRPRRDCRLGDQQTEVLAEQAARLGVRLAHVKPHGALYNVAAR